MKDVAGEALGVDPDDGGSAVNVAHDEGNGAFNALRGSGQGIVAWLRIIEDAFKAENTEVSPAGGEVCVCYLVYGDEGHLFLIIRFDAHGDWIRPMGMTMQGYWNRGVD